MIYMHYALDYGSIEKLFVNKHNVSLCFIVIIQLIQWNPYSYIETVADIEIFENWGRGDHKSGDLWSALKSRNYVHIV